MINLSQFRTRKPEFNAVSDGRVQAGLDQAEIETDATVFGNLTDKAHELLAAHILAADPTGREARLGGKANGPSETTVYMIERERLERISGVARGAL